MYRATEFCVFLCVFRFLLKRSKPDVNSTNSNTRLSEEVLADERDDSENLLQTSTVRETPPTDDHMT